MLCKRLISVEMMSPAPAEPGGALYMLAIVNADEFRFCSCKNTTSQVVMGCIWFARIPVPFCTYDITLGRSIQSSNGVNVSYIGCTLVICQVWSVNTYGS